MTKQVINTGTTANDSTGDSLRVAMGKANANFDELYAVYFSRVTSGSYTFKNSPTAATANIITSVTIPASNVARQFRVEAKYQTNSGGGNNSGLNVGLDSTTGVAMARNIPVLDGNYGFGFTADISGVIVDIPGDNATHTIQIYGGQLGGGSGFTVTTAYAAIIAKQIS